MKKILLMALAVLLLFSAMPVYAAEAVTPARQNANYMMSTAADGAPNWFNGTYYSSLYPDLQQAFGTNEVALYQHAMTHGFKEGRMVLPILDVAKYRAFYPDLDAAFGDSWGRYVRHYFEYGILEGRVNFTGFDPVAYLNMYPDLRAAFGSDLSLAARHYLEHGMTEGRAASRPVVVESKPSRPSSGSSEPSRPFPPGREDGVHDERDSTGTGWVTTVENGVIVRDEYYEAGVLVYCHTYDEEGDLKERTEYVDGVLVYRVTYDENGRLQEEVSYNPDGSVSYKFVYEYSADGLRETRRYYQGDEYMGRDETVYDDQGRVLTVHMYDFDSAGGTEELRGYSVYEYGFTGDMSGFPSKETGYRADGTVWTIRYNAEAGYSIKEERYREDGSLELISYYDENGNIPRYEEYDEAGNLTGTFDGDGNPI